MHILKFWAKIEGKSSFLEVMGPISKSHKDQGLIVKKPQSEQQWQRGTVRLPAFEPLNQSRLQLLELGRPWKTKWSRRNTFNASFCIILRILRFSLLNIEDTILGKKKKKNIEDTINNHTIMFVRLKSLALVNRYI